MIGQWLEWRDRLGAALDRRYYTQAWLDWLVMGGRAMFWATDAAAIVAEIRYFPTGAKDVHGICAAGDVDEITHVLIPIAEDWGRSNGCLSAQIDSREAWGRILRDRGFELYKTSIRKAL